MNKILQTKDLFTLTLDHSEATYLGQDALQDRCDLVQSAFDPDGVAALKKISDAYIAGDRDLTAVEFYLELEQASCLILFHTLPRRGERNKHANGLQQTYGDHIRLMMLGFDKFDASDLDWVMTRRWQAPISIDRTELKGSMDRYHALNLTRSEKVALWITSALHDYGKIFRRGYGLDAEDAAPLCADLVEALAPDGMGELIHYGIRNHDLIEYTVTGDTPSSFIAAPVDDLPQEVRARALPMLALIQHIGAASLGEGRLSGPKLAIYNACFDGTIVADGSVEARLGRMLFGGVAVPDPSATARAATILNQQGKPEQDLLSKMLGKTVLLGWEPIRDQISDAESSQETAVSRMIETLLTVGKTWSENPHKPEHIVFARPDELVDCSSPNGDKGARAANEDITAPLLNGSMALIMR